MTIHGKPTHRAFEASAICAWENEGSAPGRDSMDHHYGRRIETDRSWSVYHVFTGDTAHAGGRPMTGLSRSDATGRMIALNLHNEGRRGERRSLASPTGPRAHEIEVLRS
ncbi:hypothetical protein ACSBOB_21260 [Mesorhizobium sp. ASY16-5R]|uniref:hypothetical protein n=1 Tax=Mesorhizobium sp. ASY16-5R TaxID=3445772 RepID=UPI003FA04FB1